MNGLKIIDERAEKLWACRDRYSYMFSGQHIGRWLALGWTDTLVELLSNIHRRLPVSARRGNGRGFHLTQVKEKLGALRVYWQIGGTRRAPRIDFISAENVVSRGSSPRANDWQDEIQRMVLDAEHATATICAVCGARAKIRDLDGFLLAVCREHARKTNWSKGYAGIWFTFPSD